MSEKPWLTDEEDYYTAGLFHEVRTLEPETCEVCGGSGKRYVQDWDDKRIWDVYTCKACNGRGWIEQ